MILGGAARRELRCNFQRSGRDNANHPAIHRKTFTFGSALDQRMIGFRKANRDTQKGGEIFFFRSCHSAKMVPRIFGMETRGSTMLTGLSRAQKEGYEMRFRLAAGLCIRCGLFHRTALRPSLCEYCAADDATKRRDKWLTQVDRAWTQKTAA
jgi:hypothetical protein